MSDQPSTQEIKSTQEPEKEQINPSSGITPLKTVHGRRNQAECLQARLVCILSVCMGVEIGYDAGLVSVLPILAPPQWQLDLQWVGLATGIYAFGLAVGGVLGLMCFDGKYNTKLIIGSSGTSALLCGAMAFVSLPHWILWGRLLMGIFQGVKYLSTSLLVHSAFVNQIDMLDNLTIVNRVAFGVGYFSSTTIAALIHTATDGWCYLQGLELVPCVYASVILLLPRKDIHAGKYGGEGNELMSDDMCEEGSDEKHYGLVEGGHVEKMPVQGQTTVHFALIGLTEVSKMNEILLYFFGALMLLAGYTDSSFVWVNCLSGLFILLLSITSSVSPLFREAHLYALSTFGSFFTLLCLAFSFEFIDGFFPTTDTNTRNTSDKCNEFENGMSCILSLQCAFCGNYITGMCIDKTTSHLCSAHSQWHINSVPNSFWWVPFLFICVNIVLNTPFHKFSLMFMNGGAGSSGISMRKALAVQYTVYWAWLAFLAILFSVISADTSLTVAFFSFTALNALMQAFTILLPKFTIHRNK
eukprot:Nk52_evm32s554 gene=Nk52_evmTU32s554